MTIPRGYQKIFVKFPVYMTCLASIILHMYVYMPPLVMK